MEEYNMYYKAEKVGISMIPLDDGIKNRESSTPCIFLEYHRIQFSISSGKCQATHILTFFNSTDEVLEGEMFFPLPSKGSIMGYGLDIDHFMVDAVPIEKRKARVVFESEANRLKTRDVSILEQVENLSNVFRIRVYPLLPKKRRYVKVVVINEMDVILGENNEATMSTYLSLSTTPHLKELKFRIYPPIENSILEVKMTDGEMAGIGPKESDKNWTTTLKKPDFVSGIKISIPMKKNNGFVCIEKDTDSGYHFFSTTFLLPLPSPNERRNIPITPPSSVSNKFRLRIFYDVSHSRVKSDWRKELTFLEAFLSEIESKISSISRMTGLEIVVYPFSCTVHEEKIFFSTMEVLEYILHQEKDGGSSLPIHEILNIEQQRNDNNDNNSVTLIFSDGFFNFSTKDDITSMFEPQQQKQQKNIIFCISSENFTSSRILRYLSEEKYVDLSNIELKKIESYVQDLIRKRFIIDDQGEGGLCFVPKITTIRQSSIIADPKKSVKDMYCSVSTSSSNRYLISTVYGILIEPSDIPTIQLVLDDHHNIRSKKIKIEMKSRHQQQQQKKEAEEEDEEFFPQESTLLRTLWAQRKIERLSTMGGGGTKLRAKEIRDIGMRYNLATPNTSLMVLSKLEQFERYKICPPKQLKEIRKEYLNQIEVEEFIEEDRRKKKIEDVAGQWSRRRIKWHQTEFPIQKDLRKEEEMRKRKKEVRKHTVPKDNEVLVFMKPKMEDDEGIIPIVEVPYRQLLSNNENPLPKKWRDFIHNSIRNSSCHRRGRRYTYERYSPSVSDEGEEENDWRNQSTSKEKQKKDERKKNDEEEEYDDGSMVFLSVLERKEQDEYMRKIRSKGSMKEKYEEYLVQKKKRKYRRSPEFYLNCSHYFLNEIKNELEQAEEDEGETEPESDFDHKKIGVRILTTVLDLVQTRTSLFPTKDYDQNTIIRTQLLRIVGYRLCELRMYSQASQIFEEVMRERPKDPTSFRDLALALEELGEFQRSAELMNQIILRKWRRKYREIELTAILELNHVLFSSESSMPGSKNKIVSELKIDPRLICHKMDLDLRVCVQWDTDNTDVELNIFDNDGNRIYYGNPHSELGGLISRDVVNGYGPQEFIQKKVNIMGHQEKKAEKEYRVTVQNNSHVWNGDDNILALAGGTVLCCKFFTNYMRENEKSEVVYMRLKEHEETEVCRIKL